ncbi:hypothetical protein JCM15908A_18230 [Prevotella dentasini JCM 15908]
MQSATLNNNQQVPADLGNRVEDTAMTRKPKMFNEHEFDMDNAYQDDERQVDIFYDNNERGTRK